MYDGTGNFTSEQARDESGVKQAQPAKPTTKTYATAIGIGLLGGLAAATLWLAIYFLTTNQVIVNFPDEGFKVRNWFGQWIMIVAVTTVLSIFIFYIDSLFNDSPDTQKSSRKSFDALNFGMGLGALVTLGAFSFGEYFKLYSREENQILPHIDMSEWDEDSNLIRTFFDILNIQDSYIYFLLLIIIIAVISFVFIFYNTWPVVSKIAGHAGKILDDLTYRAQKKEQRIREAESEKASAEEEYKKLQAKRAEQVAKRTQVEIDLEAAHRERACLVRQHEHASFYITVLEEYVADISAKRQQQADQKTLRGADCSSALKQSIDLTVSALDRAVVELNASREIVDGELFILTQALADVDKRISDLSRQRHDIDRDIASLTLKIEPVAGRIGQLLSEINVLTKQAADLRTEAERRNKRFGPVYIRDATHFDVTPTVFESVNISPPKETERPLLTVVVALMLWLGVATTTPDFNAPASDAKASLPLPLSGLLSLAMAVVVYLTGWLGTTVANLVSMAKLTGAVPLTDGSRVEDVPTKWGLAAFPVSAIATFLVFCGALGVGSKQKEPVIAPLPEDLTLARLSCTVESKPSRLSGPSFRQSPYVETEVSACKIEPNGKPVNYVIILGTSSHEGGDSQFNKDLATERAKLLADVIAQQDFVWNGKPLKARVYYGGLGAHNEGTGQTQPNPLASEKFGTLNEEQKTSDQRGYRIYIGYAHTAGRLKRTPADLNAERSTEPLKLASLIEMDATINARALNTVCPTLSKYPEQKVCEFEKLTLLRQDKRVIQK